MRSLLICSAIEKQGRPANLLFPAHHGSIQSRFSSECSMQKWGCMQTGATPGKSIRAPRWPRKRVFVNGEKEHSLPSPLPWQNKNCAANILSFNNLQCDERCYLTNHKNSNFGRLLLKGLVVHQCSETDTTPPNF